jgi:hypothetical protein
VFRENRVELDERRFKIGVHRFQMLNLGRPVYAILAHSVGPQGNEHVGDDDYELTCASP